MHGGQPGQPKHVQRTKYYGGGQPQRGENSQQSILDIKDNRNSGARQWWLLSIVMVSLLVLHDRRYQVSSHGLGRSYANGSGSQGYPAQRPLTDLRGSGSL